MQKKADNSNGMKPCVSSEMIPLDLGVAAEMLEMHFCSRKAGLEP